MSLVDLIAGTAIIDGGKHLNKQEIVHQLLTLFAADGHIATEDVPALLQAVMKREALATTGIGAGIAIPHAMHPAVPRHKVLLALCRTPVEFDCIDGDAADIFALCLAPPISPGASSRAMLDRSFALMRKLGDKDFCQRLRSSQTPEEIRTCFAGLPEKF